MHPPDPRDSQDEEQKSKDNEQKQLGEFKDQEEAEKKEIDYVYIFEEVKDSEETLQVLNKEAAKDGLQFKKGPIHYNSDKMVRYTVDDEIPQSPFIVISPSVRIPS